MPPCRVMHSVIFALCHIGIFKHYQTHIGIRGYKFSTVVHLKFQFYTTSNSFIHSCFVVSYRNTYLILVALSVLQFHIWLSQVCWIMTVFHTITDAVYIWLSLYFIKIWKMLVKINIQMFLQTSSLKLFKVLSLETRCLVKKHWTSNFWLCATVAQWATMYYNGNTINMW